MPVRRRLAPANSCSAFQPLSPVIGRRLASPPPESAREGALAGESEQEGDLGDGFAWFLDVAQRQILACVVHQLLVGEVGLGKLALQGTALQRAATLERSSSASCFARIASSVPASWRFETGSTSSTSRRESRNESRAAPKFMRHMSSRIESVKSVPSAPVRPSDRRTSSGKTCSGPGGSRP